MFGYIYKVIHKPTGRYYIGQHQGNNPQGDNYFGSGNVWRLIFKAHPNSEFEKSVLATAETIEELNRLEEFYIGDLYNTDKLCMNRKSGGLGSVASEEWKTLISKKMKGNKNGIGNKGRVFTEESLKRMSISTQNRPPCSGETREKLSQLTSGKNNPMFGRRKEQAPAFGKHWYTDGINNILAFECPEGYKVGRTYSQFNNNKGKKNICL